MIKLGDYRDKYRYCKLERTANGVLTVVLHSDGGA
jgi:hypothetical protein